MSAAAPSTRLPSAILMQLNRLRGMIGRYVLGQAFCLAGLLAIVCFWAFAWVDYGPIQLGSQESPRWARIAMLAFLVAGVVGIGIHLGLRKWWVRWPHRSLALLIERKYPEFESSLSTSVLGLEARQARRRREGPQGSTPEQALTDAMLDRSLTQAVDRIQSVDVASLLHWPPIRWQASLLGVAIGISLVAVAWHWDWTAHWCKRFFALSDEPWPRRVRLEVEGLELNIPSFTGSTERKRYLQPIDQRRARVARGASCILRVLADTHAPMVPDACTVHYRSQDGARGRSDMKRLAQLAGEHQPFLLEGPPLESMDQPLDFSVSAEDLRIAGYRIELVDSPVLSELSLHLQYPSYLQKQGGGTFLPETMAYRSGMRLPQGTQIRLSARANKPLVRCDYLILSTNPPPQAQEQGPAPQSLQIDGDGFELTLPPLQENTLIEFCLWDTDGICSERILQYVIGVQSDDPPTVDLALQGIGTSVTPMALLPWQTRIQDDHGIRRGWIEMVVNESATLELPVETPVDGRAEGALDLRELGDQRKLPIAVKSTLSLTTAADDHFDLSESPHVGRAAPIQLAIVTPEELLIQLERRELAMRNRIELILSELGQMRGLLEKMPEDVASASPVPAASDQTTEPAPPTSLQPLRAQQSAMQAEKSEGELSGVEQEIAKIRDELTHNRVDSQDRRERLEGKVRQPLSDLLATPMPELIRHLRSMERTALQGPLPEPTIRQAIVSSDQIIAALKDILQNMIDIQDFNEVLDMVREMIDKQDALIDETKKEQRKQVSDLLKGT
jgi:hypothetical protein